MGSGHNFQKFVTAILKLSDSKDWLEAKPEWELHAVYQDPSERSCECGHQPINQICIIRNRENGNEAEVGNVCVHNFMQLASRRIFAVLKRVRAQTTKSLNPASLELFAQRGAISAGEMADYLEYWRKRTDLTPAQRNQKADINQRVLKYWDDESARLAANFISNGLKPRGAKPPTPPPGYKPSHPSP